MKAFATLTAAKATILQVGWGRGDEETCGDNAQKCCVITAISRNVPKKRPSIEYDDAVAVFLFANTYIRDPLPVWNDARGRTLNEVLTAFDNAIAFAKTLEARPVTH